ncbi:MAG: hypothetical protein AB7V55_04520 [Oscillospiraceae bacterium]
MEKKNWIAPEIESLGTSNTELLPIGANSYDFTFKQNGWVGLGDYRDDNGPRCS